MRPVRNFRKNNTTNTQEKKIKDTIDPRFTNILNRTEYKNISQSQSTEKESSAKVSNIILIFDQLDRIATPSSIYTDKYLVTSPGCTHGIPPAYKLRQEEADISGYFNIPLPQLKEQSFILPPHKYNLSCPICFPSITTFYPNIKYRLSIQRIEGRGDVNLFGHISKVVHDINVSIIEDVIFVNCYNLSPSIIEHVDEFLTLLSSKIKVLNIVSIEAESEFIFLSKQLAKFFNCNYTILNNPIFEPGPIKLVEEDLSTVDASSVIFDDFIPSCDSPPFDIADSIIISPSPYSEVSQDIIIPSKDSREAFFQFKPFIKSTLNSEQKFVINHYISVFLRTLTRNQISGIFPLTISEDTALLYSFVKTFKITKNDLISTFLEYIFENGVNFDNSLSITFADTLFP